MGEKLTWQEIKNTDMVDFLSRLGYEPERGKTSKQNYWYRSPLRDENTPSFKVNRNINRWYDHGIGKGGTLIDFGMAYYQCTLGDFLKRFNENDLFQQKRLTHSKPEKSEPESKLIILNERPLTSTALLDYLGQRKIPGDLAAQYCSQVEFELNDKKGFAIGFKNDADGYEIRNPYFKASSAPKAVTTFHQHSDEVLVFEGFMDFLSHQVLYPGQSKKQLNAVVLNSINLFESIRPYLEQHRLIRLFLDQDNPGRKLTVEALAISRQYQDTSHIYIGKKDLNEYLIAQQNKLDNRPGMKI